MRREEELWLFGADDLSGRAYLLLLDERVFRQIDADLAMHERPPLDGKPLLFGGGKRNFFFGGCGFGDRFGGLRAEKNAIPRIDPVGVRDVGVVRPELGPVPGRSEVLGRKIPERVAFLHHDRSGV